MGKLARKLHDHLTQHAKRGDYFRATYIPTLITSIRWDLLEGINLRSLHMSAGLSLGVRSKATQVTFSPVSFASSVDSFFTFQTVAKWSVRFPNAATRAPSRLKATSVYRRSVPPRRVPHSTIPG